MKKRLKLLGITFLIFGICLVCGLVIPSDSAVYPVGGNIMVPAATDTRTSVELPVLMYHSISEDSAKNEYNITPQAFESDLKWLKDNGYTTVSAKQLADYVENGTMLPEKPVLLTFDDGYENNYTNAFPLLKKYNMKAVISLIGKDLRLNENQLKEMHDSGLVEIGSHTYDLHSISGDVKGADKKPGETQEEYRKRLTDDLQKSIDEITRITGKAPIVFAWPYGAYPLDRSADQILKDLGFKVSLTSYQIKNNIEKDNPNSTLGLRRFLRTPDFDISRII